MGFLREAFIPFIVLSYIALYAAFTLGKPAESTIFPYTVMTFIAIVSVVLLFYAWKARNAAVEAAEERSSAPLVFGLALLFVIGFAFLGFAVAAFAFLVVSLISLGTKPVTSIIISVILTGGIYLLFAVGLGVSL